MYQWFWGHFPGQHITKGRRYIRFYMAYILHVVCTEHPYGMLEQEAESQDESVGRLEELVKWNSDQWSEIQKDLTTLRSLILRKDATLNYLDPEDVLEDGETVDIERATSPVIKEKFDLILEQITIHMALAPVRYGLESQVRDHIKEKAKISRRDLDTVWARASSLPANHRAREAIFSLFQKESRDKSGKPPHLMGLLHLKQSLHEAPFDLVRFQNDMERLMHRLNELISGHQDCALIQARYAIPQDSELFRILAPSHRRKVRSVMDQEHIDELRRGRTALNTGHGDDPLDAAVAAAQGARRSPGRAKNAEDSNEEDSFDENEQPKRKGRLTIVDDMEDEEEADTRRIGAQLSQIPQRKRPAVSVFADYAGTVPPDEGIFDEQGKVKKRLRWTDEEKLAVKEGVKTCGIGKWAQIKREHATILRNRTPVQIKDCWRTMTKQNEV
jgi:hypothetical protein